MSYTPQVGDRVKWGKVDPNIGVAVYVTDTEVVVDRGRNGGLCIAQLWVVSKYEPRPTIAAEQWGYVTSRGQFWPESTEHNAQVWAETHGYTLAKLHNGVLVDEHGQPFDVEPRP